MGAISEKKRGDRGDQFRYASSRCPLSLHSGGESYLYTLLFKKTYRAYEVAISHCQWDVKRLIKSYSFQDGNEWGNLPRGDWFPSSQFRPKRAVPPLVSTPVSKFVSASCFLSFPPVSIVSCLNSCTGCYFSLWPQVHFGRPGKNC